MSQSNKVSTLWLRGRLRNIDHVCLASMVANDLDVTLFHYEDISNIPKIHQVLSKYTKNYKTTAFSTKINPKCSGKNL